MNDGATVGVVAVVIIVTIIIIAAVAGSGRSQVPLRAQDKGPRPCPYCESEISGTATRCKHCAGELRYCPSCRENVGLVGKQKFVGVMRGGMKTQFRCQQCRRVLDGPRM